VGTPSAHGTLSDRWEIRSEFRAAPIKVHASFIFIRTSADSPEVQVPNSSVQDDSQELALIGPYRKHF